MLVLFTYKQYNLDLITLNEDRDEMGQEVSMMDKTLIPEKKMETKIKK